MISKKQLLEIIAKAEGTSFDVAKSKGYSSEYDVTYGHDKYVKPPKPISQMTMGEVKAYQKQLINATKGKVPGTNRGTSAVGKYQIISSTLNELQRKLKLSDGDLFTQDIQDRMGGVLLDRAGYSDFQAGKLTQSEFQSKLVGTWTSLPDPTTGKSKYNQPTGIGNDFLTAPNKYAPGAYGDAKAKDILSIDTTPGGQYVYTDLYGGNKSTMDASTTLKEGSNPDDDNKMKLVNEALSRKGIRTTDKNGQPILYSELAKQYAGSLHGNKDLANKSMDDYPSHLDYLMDVLVTSSDGINPDVKSISEINPSKAKEYRTNMRKTYIQGGMSLAKADRAADDAMMRMKMLDGPTFNNPFIIEDELSIEDGNQEYLSNDEIKKRGLGKDPHLMIEDTAISNFRNNNPELFIPSHKSDILDVGEPLLNIDDPSNLPDINNPNKPNAGDYASLLRFAPAVGSLVNMLDKDKPYDINLQKMGASEKLTPEQVNEMMLNSELASAYNSAVGNITNMSGGNQGVARANVQGVNIGNAKAKADAFSKVNMFNIQNKLGADQFNIQNANAINQGNVGITNQEKMIDMQNKLAAESKKEADRAAFYNSLGQIGVEQFYSNVASSANSGYGTDIYGRKTYKPQ